MCTHTHKHTHTHTHTHTQHTHTQQTYTQTHTQRHIIDMHTSAECESGREDKPWLLTHVGRPPRSHTHTHTHTHRETHTHTRTCSRSYTNTCPSALAAANARGRVALHCTDVRGEAAGSKVRRGAPRRLWYRRTLPSAPAVRNRSLCVTHTHISAHTHMGYVCVDGAWAFVFCDMCVFVCVLACVRLCASMCVYVCVCVCDISYLVRAAVQSVHSSCVLCVR